MLYEVNIKVDWSPYFLYSFLKKPPYSYKYLKYLQIDWRLHFLTLHYLFRLRLLSGQKLVVVVMNKCTSISLPLVRSAARSLPSLQYISVHKNCMIYVGYMETDVNWDALLWIKIWNHLYLNFHFLPINAKIH